MAYVMKLRPAQYIDVSHSDVISLELKNHSYNEDGMKNFMGKHLVVKRNNIPCYSIEMRKKNGEFEYNIYYYNKKSKFIPAKREVDVFNSFESIEWKVRDIISSSNRSIEFKDLMEKLFDGKIKLTRNGRSIR